MREMKQCITPPYDYFEWVTEGVLTFLVGLIGLVGNAMSIWTFSRRRVHRIFHNLLLVLAIFDLVSSQDFDLYLSKLT